MEKVKLPRNVADAITHLKTHHGGNETLLAGLLGNANGSCIITIREFCYSPYENFNLILSALVNGYEVEETPEDKIREAYNRADLIFFKDDIRVTDYQNGMHKVLEILNIKIEGIN